jgi:hypothetical protein
MLRAGAALGFRAAGWVTDFAAAPGVAIGVTSTAEPLQGTCKACVADQFG